MTELDAFHTAQEIAPRTFRIDEAGLANCYLLEGNDAALLIDAGCGAGDLGACVRRLTDKPVVAAVTHRHPDHVGGMWRFGSYYAAAPDRELIYSLLCLPCFRRAMLRRAGCGKGAFTRPKHAAVLPMEDGRVFALGGRNVRVVPVPGHTKGSVLFLDEGEKLIFTGDDINPDLWMHLPGCTSLRTWCAGAGRILALMKEGYAAWNGHGDGRQAPQQARETERLVRELLAKRASGALRARRGSYPAPDAKIVIRYRF